MLLQHIEIDKKQNIIEFATLCEAFIINVAPSSSTIAMGRPSSIKYRKVKILQTVYLDIGVSVRNNVISSQVFL